MSERGEPEQESLFDNGPAWTEHWRGMPEYEHGDLTPAYTLLLHFRSREDFLEFSKLINQPGLTFGSSRGAWFPEVNMERALGVTRYRDDDEK